MILIPQYDDHGTCVLPIVASSSKNLRTMLHVLGLSCSQAKLARLNLHYVTDNHLVRFRRMTFKYGITNVGCTTTGSTGYW